jgi:hypothetical protein
MALLSVRETSELLGLNETRLANYRRSDILAGGESNPKFLKGTQEPGSRQIFYDSKDILAFISRPENRVIKEFVFASFVPAAVRLRLEENLLDQIPELDTSGPNEEMPPANVGQMLEQSAWANYAKPTTQETTTP